MRRGNMLIVNKGFKYTVSLSTLMLQLYIGLAFTLHLFIYGLSSNTYIASALTLVLLYAVMKPVIKSSISIGFAFHWALAFLVMIFSYVFSYRSGVVLIDLIILLSGVVSAIAFSSDVRTYKGAIAYIKVLALFFMSGVLLQRFIPSLYYNLIRLFPSRLYDVIRNSGEGAYRGFTTNTGFTVNYILVGILAVISEGIVRDKWTVGEKILITLMILAVIFTGKRGPILFFIIALIYCNLIPARGAKRFKRFWSIFIGASIIVILFLTFEDALADIPIFGEVLNTINGIASGEDVTSGRTRLYAWALKLFLAHPIKGVGWGYFRRTVVGEITRHTTLDVHNVYLQLLCETGIPGFAVFISIFISNWVATKKAYCSCFVNKNSTLFSWRPVLLFSFVFQTYFLLYSLTGNPLYDQFYQIIYLFCCSITVAYKYLSVRSVSYSFEHNHVKSTIKNGTHVRI